LPLLFFLPTQADLFESEGIAMAADKLEVIRAEWEARAPGWNERNLKGWDTEETAAWWQGWLGELRPYLPPPGPDVRLLDAGCGNGQLSVLYAKEGYLVRGCDFSANMVQYATENAARYSLHAPQIEFVQASIDAMPYPDSEFDIVNCRCVLDFTPRPAYALHELRRVTKSGGTLVLMMMGAASPIKRQFWQRWLVGIDPHAEGSNIFNLIAPWEVEQIMPHLGWQLLHHSGQYGATASGSVNQFSADQMADQPLLFQQAAATGWLIVAQAVAPQPLEG